MEAVPGQKCPGDDLRLLLDADPQSPGRNAAEFVKGCDLLRDGLNELRAQPSPPLRWVDPQLDKLDHPFASLRRVPDRSADCLAGLGEPDLLQK